MSVPAAHESAMRELPVAPMVSVIVLFLPGSRTIDSCVAALRRNTPERVSHELIIVANGASNVPDSVAQDSAVRVLRSRANLGFGGGCNWASRHARGRYLAFVNDDAIVSPGWLEGLVEPVESESRIGAVGSLILRPDGLVAEAGRVLWREGVSSGIGEGGTSERMARRGVRSADYCSACSLLVRRTAWGEVGGFDENYYPAYYEDVDLCLGLASRGWKVVCAPASMVVHRQHGSSSEAWRSFVGARNHRYFATKWAHVLEACEPRPTDRPTGPQVEAAAAAAAAVAARGDGRRYHHAVPAKPSRRPRDALQRGGLPATDDATERLELLETEVVHLRAELDLKESFVTHLTNSPEMRRALARVHSHQRRRERLRTLIQRLPLVGPAARRLARIARRMRLR